MAAASNALRTTLGNSSIARLEGAWACAMVGKWAFTILIALYAYNRGGPTAVGLAAVVRALPSVVAAPYIALLVDRCSRVVAIRLSCAVRAAMALWLAVLIHQQATLPWVLGLAAVLTVADTAHRPAQAAMLPLLARTPSELGAANVIWTVFDSVGFLTGSLLVGLLVEQGGVAACCLACALAYGSALALALTLPSEKSLLQAPSVGPAVLAGLRTIVRDPKLRVLGTVYGANVLVDTMLDALVVIAAVELLGMGEQGAGWLNAAWAIGGIAGGAVATGLLARGRLTIGVLAGAAAAGGSLLLLGSLPSPSIALVSLVMFGAGVAVFEIAHRNLTQRQASADVLARVYGVQEVADVVAVGLGGILVAGLVAWIGPSAAFVTVGAGLIVVVAALNRPLRSMGAKVAVPEATFAALRRLTMFAVLPVSVVENLASHVRNETFAAGADITVQGEVGTAFYVIENGLVEVVIDGLPYNQHTTGEFFGETALLRDLPRTATVRATVPTRVLAIDRAEFLTAVGSHALSRREFDDIVERRRPKPS